MTNSSRKEVRSNIQSVLTSLTAEHIKILRDLELIEDALEAGQNKLGAELIVIIKDLSHFTKSDHHRREEDILFSWMLSQSPDADVSVIDHICNEHRRLEALDKKITTQLDGLVSNNLMYTPISLLHDLQDFLDLYREHIELEEKFIYLIARGLITTWP